MNDAPWVVALPGTRSLALASAAACGAELIELALHHYPDGETGVRVPLSPSGRDVMLCAALDRPDEKMALLHFAASTLREHGARRIVLIAPYLPYMRQDRAFSAGTGTLARHYAQWLSTLFDGLVTVDPHLHRIHALREIYSMPTQAVAAAPEIAGWIAQHGVAPPLLVGPDAESAPWIAAVAKLLDCPQVCFEKIRRGDAEVELQLPSLHAYAARQAIIVDDIVSTAATMIASVAALQRAGFVAPVCIAVHALFAGDAYERLRASGVVVVSGNSVAHPSNAIDLQPRIAAAACELLATLRSKGAQP